MLIVTEKRKGQVHKRMTKHNSWGKKGRSEMEKKKKKKTP
jgi:hypothetical protein